MDIPYLTDIPKKGDVLGPFRIDDVTLDGGVRRQRIHYTDITTGTKRCCQLRVFTRLLNERRNGGRLDTSPRNMRRRWKKSATTET